MSTPVVSGAIALLLQQQPTLSPDQVKAALTGSTQSYGSHSGVYPPDPSADGAGLLDAFATTYGPPRAPTKGGRPADGVARALYPVLYGIPLVWKDAHYQGIDWTSVNWSNLVWDNLAWDNLAWDNVAWDNLAWDNLAWDNLAWDNLAWDNLAWDNLAWDSAGLD
jgi:serine protease AprX